MDVAPNFLALCGRLLLASLFVQAGIGKLGNIAGTAGHMADHGIPLAQVLVWGAVAVELGGGLLLMTGLLTRLAALLLFFYTLTLALIFHAYWTLPAAAARAEHTAFFNHLSIMGGMLCVAAFGAGAYSLDALVWRRPRAFAPAE